MVQALLPMALLSASVASPMLLAEDGPVAAACAGWIRAAEAYRQDGMKRRWKQKIRWALASATRPTQALTWFQSVETGGMAPFAVARPGLAFKPLRVYLSSRWNLARRRKVLVDTYAFVLARGGVLEAALLAGNPLDLAQVDLPTLGPVAFRLGTDERFRKEGELVLFLDCPSLGGTVAALSFALERLPGESWALRAGCVQGHDHADPETVRLLSKAMHGLRPKAAMVFLAQAVARSLDLHQVLGAGNAIQVHRRKHAIHIPWLHALSCDYDALWTEAGGIPQEDGWFRLPAGFQRRAPEDIKPNKRSLYARRYALMEQIEAQVGAAFSDGTA